ncbi:MAG: plasmid recombination protein [Paracoccus sp. (in: a-proteobacteria)]|nr:plasmid recombination protein [Paracoccus sp. (in: a-proteobacteria)]
MTSTIKAAIRLKRLMSALDISNATRHGKRLGKIAHVDRSRSHLNRHWEYQAGALVGVDDAPDLADALEKRRSDRGAVRRSNTPTLATEIMFITTRDAFVNKHGQIDIERAYSWADEMIEAFEKRYPGMSAAARLDLDERSPHLSVFAVPIYLKQANKPRADIDEAARAKRKPRAPKPTVSHKQVFGGIEDMRELQRWVQGLNSEFLARFGLNLTASTSRIESGANHIHPDDFRRIMGDVNKIKSVIEAGALQEATELIQNASGQVEQMLTAADAAAAEIKADITAEAEAERDAARKAAQEARAATDSAVEEAKALLDAMRPVRSMKPLHEAYTALLDGSSITPRQALAATTAADEDRQWANFDPIAFPRENTVEREDRDAAVWLAHPEVAAEVQSKGPEPLLADLMEPASGSTCFRARFFSRFRQLRDFVLNAVQTVLQRRTAALPTAIQARLNDPEFSELINLGQSIKADNLKRIMLDAKDDGVKSAAADAALIERQKLLSQIKNPATAAKEDLWAEAKDAADAASVVAHRIQRGPRQVLQWLQIPSDLRANFTAALDAAAALETALARRIAPGDPEKRPAGGQERGPAGQGPEI